MLKKIKNVVYVLLMITFFSVCTFVLINGGVKSVTTDSGFDSSYGGGGSSSSSGSSGGGYSSSGGSSSSGGGSYSSDGAIGGGFIFIIILVVVIIIVVNSTAKQVKNITIEPTRRSLIGLSDEEVKNRLHIQDVYQFYADRIMDFLDVQFAWMEFKYDTLREKLTDELFNQYQMQLSTLSAKGQKNIMSNFQALDKKITKIENNNGVYEVTMELVIRFLDYITENGRVVRGNSFSPITMHYELVFVCSSLEESNTCPHCGAPITDSASQVCEYCKSTITRKSSKWVLSKKKALNQE